MWAGRTSGKRMQKQHRCIWKAFKLQAVFDEGRSTDKEVDSPTIQPSRSTVPPGLCGSPTETSILVSGVPTTTLLDTGSTVSTISQQFFEDHLNHLQLQPLDSILNIECADGQSLPYLGYIEVDIQMTILRMTPVILVYSWLYPTANTIRKCQCS